LRSVIGDVELLELPAVGIQLLRKDEEVHVVRAVRLNLQLHLGIPDELGRRVDTYGE
jgi:hypothetical protein